MKKYDKYETKNTVMHKIGLQIKMQPKYEKRQNTSEN